MKSITSKLSIIILSLLASTYTFAFGHGAVCSAMNDAVNSKNVTSLPIYWGPITNIYSRNTDGSDPRGEVVGTLGGWKDRISSQSGLECSGDTCHVNKEWGDCECTSSACAEDAVSAFRNCYVPAAAGGGGGYVCESSLYYDAQACASKFNGPGSFYGSKVCSEHDG
jgi:hypothetical protein